MNRVTLIAHAHCELCERAKQVLARASAWIVRWRSSRSRLPPNKGASWRQTSACCSLPAVMLDGKPFLYGRLSEPQVGQALEYRR